MMSTPSEKETLIACHRQMEKVLVGTELIDYYLTTSDALRNESLEDWLSCFQGRLPEPCTGMQSMIPKPENPKKRRGCPGALCRPRADLPPCRSCASREVVEDVNEGSVVCIQCGMIQGMHVGEDAVTDAKFHEGVSRIVVHRYSRMAYLRWILLSHFGETTLKMDTAQEEAIRQFCRGIPRVFPKHVQVAVRQLRLPRRFMRHAPAICQRLFPESRHNPVHPSADELDAIFRRFREYENVWENAGSAKFKQGKRSFPGQRIVWRFLCLELGFYHLSSMFEFPCGVRAARSQWAMLLYLQKKLSSQ